MKSLPEPPGSDSPPSEFRRGQQHPRPFQAQSPDHAQAGFGLVADTRQRTVIGRQHHFGQLFVVGEQGKQLAVAQGLHAPRRHFIEDILHKSRK